MLVVEALSAGLSPAVAAPEAAPGATPFEKLRFAEMVEGPPGFMPFMATNMVRQDAGGIRSVPFDSFTTPCSFEITAQPAGKT
jgi:hypothetical protein